MDSDVAKPVPCSGWHVRLAVSREVLAAASKELPARHFNRSLITSVDSRHLTPSEELNVDAPEPAAGESAVRDLVAACLWDRWLESADARGALAPPVLSG
jgi:hypothetical protein